MLRYRDHQAKELNADPFTVDVGRFRLAPQLAPKLAAVAAHLGDTLFQRVTRFREQEDVVREANVDD